MSAIGPKRTLLIAPHMSAFGGKADMTFCGNPLSRSLFGAKRTCLLALQMSACDPKRTSVVAPHMSACDLKQTSLRGVAALFREIAERKHPPSVN
jgi:hypothetical protein